MFAIALGITLKVASEPTECRKLSDVDGNSSGSESLSLPIQCYFLGFAGSRNFLFCSLSAGSYDDIYPKGFQDIAC